VSEKQLGGSLIGCPSRSRTGAGAQAKPRHLGNQSGCDVADSAAGEAKAAFTFRTTRSPDLMIVRCRPARQCAVDGLHAVAR